MDWLKSYFSFNKAERSGIAALFLLLIVLTGTYVALPLLVDSRVPEPDPALVAALKKYEQVRLSADGSKTAGGKMPIAGEPFRFDPNTIDSIECLRLGLRPVTARMLLNWRRKGKIFYRKEDFREVFTLKVEEYDRLAPYIAITASQALATRINKFPQQAPLPDHINLNTTDSATIVRLNGIGPTLAHRIIARRNALGGFLRHEQLDEVFRFPDTTFSMLKQRLVINAAEVRKLSLNNADFEAMKAHPYIGEKIARNIILYREGLKRYSQIEQLRQVPLMNEEIYRKIAPYFVLE